MIKSIIIDDMPQAIEVLKSDLETYCPDVEVVDTADSVVTGAKLIKATKPELIFLDIMLGDGTGFDVLEIMTDQNFKVIFTTASDEHALRAFRYAAVDYLLKPIDPEELKDAVERAQHQINTQRDQIPLLKDAYENQKPEKIALHTQEKVMIVEVKDIIRCESDNNCTFFFFSSGKKLLVTKTLKGFEEILKDHGFIRTHQSHLVNGAYIKEFVKTDGGYLILEDQQQIPISVRRKPHVMKWLEKI